MNSNGSSVNGNTASLPRDYDTYTWRGHKINFRRERSGQNGNAEGRPAVLFVHGFGASINSWRFNIDPVLEAGHDVYCLDLLGFGASAKPDLEYSIAVWRDLVADFLKDAGHQEWVLVGNSLGSLISVAVARELQAEALVSGMVLINCAGGMTTFRYSDFSPPVAFIAWVVKGLLFNPVVGRLIFNRVRSDQQLRKTLEFVYVNPDAVTDELISIIQEPAADHGACEVFLRVLNGEAGPRPSELLAELRRDLPIHCVWGRQDPFTPFADGRRFPSMHPNLTLEPIDECGHCCYDEKPDVVNKEIRWFLANRVCAGSMETV
eukprot:Plantae.Rhodophyta-Rhodochaete_pulchella.ctg41013.p1 GENE.Plantae.Rhodophyta-Rhodochaete_pulchella.ctg41013~~Plantae.Rhodophyta-Rhodochaete_pulchella.ctg41013.p1  ORF type:complete len:349 (+),score=39.90 Plantae.Rhodophyta-Rhodochaete_pulchella.ctg41013:89-1048(+)